MKYFPHLLRKEHLAHRAWLCTWLGLGVLWFVSGLAELGGWLPPLTQHRLADITGGVAVVIGLVLVAHVFQTERASSPHAFWRTRPPGGGVVLASQTAFVLVWGILWPALLRGLLSLVISRSLAVAGEVAAVTALWAFLLCLPLAVIASAAKGLTEFAGELIVAILIFGLSLSAFPRLAPYVSWAESGSLLAAGVGFLTAWALLWRGRPVAMRLALIAGLLMTAIAVFERGKREDRIAKDLREGRSGSNRFYQFGEYSDSRRAYLRAGMNDRARSWWPATDVQERFRPPADSGWEVAEEISLPLEDGATGRIGAGRYRLRRGGSSTQWWLEEQVPSTAPEDLYVINPVLIIPRTGVEAAYGLQPADNLPSVSLPGAVARWVLSLPVLLTKDDPANEGLCLKIAALRRTRSDAVQRAIPAAADPGERERVAEKSRIRRALSQRLKDSRLNECSGAERRDRLRTLLTEHPLSGGSPESMAWARVAWTLMLEREWYADRDREPLVTALESVGRPYARFLAQSAVHDDDFGKSGYQTVYQDAGRIDLVLEALHRVAGAEALSLLDQTGSRQVFERYSLQYGWTPQDVPLLVKWSAQSLPPAQWLPDILPVLKAQAGTLPRWRFYPDPVRPGAYPAIKALATLEGYPWPEAAEFLWSLAMVGSSGRDTILRVLVETGVPLSPQRLVDSLVSTGDLKYQSKRWDQTFPDMPMGAWFRSCFPIPEHADPVAWLRAHAGELTFDAPGGRWVLP